MKLAQVFASRKFIWIPVISKKNQCKDLTINTFDASRGPMLCTPPLSFMNCAQDDDSSLMTPIPHQNPKNPTNKHATCYPAELKRGQRQRLQKTRAFLAKFKIYLQRCIFIFLSRGRVTCHFFKIVRSCVLGSVLLSHVFASCSFVIFNKTLENGVDHSVVNTHEKACDTVREQRNQ